MGKQLLRIALHTAIGGFAAGLATVPAGGPITTKTYLYPALASSLTSVISLFATSPRQ